MTLCLAVSSHPERFPRFFSRGEMVPKAFEGLLASLLLPLRVGHGTQGDRVLRRLGAAFGTS